LIWQKGGEGRGRRSCEFTKLQDPIRKGGRGRREKGNEGENGWGVVVLLSRRAMPVLAPVKKRRGRSKRDAS